MAEKLEGLTNERRLCEILQSGAVAAARDLLGWRLYTKETDGTLTGGTITETEAYNQDDAASHSYRGVTPRTEVMFGPAGHAYVYFTYGMHWCMNIVAGADGRGEAVLIRSILSEENIDVIRNRRGNKPDTELTNGPAKICQALQISGKDNKIKINEGRIILQPPISGGKKIIQATERIGIKEDTHRLWRFSVVTDTN
jgi:DNA-3-methyladenine glycosylase